MSKVNRVVDYKYKTRDKWDAHRPNKHWMSHNFMVSSAAVQFHAETGWMSYADNSGDRYGINKKLHKVSGYGIAIDGDHVGKNEEV